MRSGELAFLVVEAIIFGFIGLAVGRRKGRPVLGFWLGFLIGLIGVIIIACIPRTQAAKMAAAQRQYQLQGNAGYPYQPYQPYQAPGQGAYQPYPGAGQPYQPYPAADQGQYQPYPPAGQGQYPQQPTPGQWQQPQQGQWQQPQQGQWQQPPQGSWEQQQPPAWPGQQQ